ncbi:hypothetical protein [Paraburkholderia sp. BL10I2N1]|uniref:hypothetical protein n=1 Tax=Paraburkholderia sp. BL10I2N1 TaxID=1938796 RepID=UPI00105F0314|nr:hypothetical protein [Paraburkholderia sp. BL10I2N1]TDN69518.1 hypothetical protein B0G77_2917 [Paraburkholderia sp. BL10I2N1]
MKPIAQTLLLAALLVSGACTAFAQTPPPGIDDGPRGHERMPPGPGFAVVNDLEHLQRLYDLSGREDEMNTVYHDVLQKTQDPAIRHYVYDALARNQLRPANADQAIATIRTSLDEDLTALAKHPPAPPRGTAQ